MILGEGLEQWWQQQSEKEIEGLLPKAKKYGAYDLEAIGHLLCHMLGKKEATTAEKAELACYFYLLGKVGRMASAYAAGELPSEDTLLDAGIYARMMQRIRETGKWP